MYALSRRVKGGGKLHDVCLTKLREKANEEIGSLICFTFPTCGCPAPAKMLVALRRTEQMKEEKEIERETYIHHP